MRDVVYAPPSPDDRVCMKFAYAHMLSIMVCVYNLMIIKTTLHTDLCTNFCAMATDKKARISEVYPFMDFPLNKFVLRKPEFITKSVCSIPEIKDNVRAPFINLTPTTTKWLRVCSDVDPAHASSLKDERGVQHVFKLVIAVTKNRTSL